MDAVDAKVDRFREELSGRIEALDHKLDRKTSSQFQWLVGIQTAFFLAIMAALAGGFYALR